MVKVRILIATAGALAAAGIDAHSHSTPFYPRSSASLPRRTRHPPPPAAGTAVWRVPRGGAVDGAAASAVAGHGSVVVTLLSGLADFLRGAKSDALVLLATTALVAPLCQRLGVSNILGLLAAGMALGPNGIRGGLIADVHRTEMLAELGIVFFLFEMGLHINFDTLMSMKQDVFGLGLAQVVLTGGAVAGLAKLCGTTSAAAIVLGGGIALSSSAFVLQLLKDQRQLETPHGQSSLGVLILQDLAVVPLLVVTPLLAGDGDGMGKAFASAGVAFLLAIAALGTCAQFVFDPLFDAVVRAHSQEAFIGLILSTVLGMSFLTEGLGLSNTLGAFVSGMILASSQHKEKIEAEVGPFRGVLVGLFFFSVGFEIDLGLLASRGGLVASLVLGTMALKAAIVAGLCRLRGLAPGDAGRAGLLLCQVSEFAFVAFRMARAHGILDEATTGLWLTAVSLTMALTPLAEGLGARLAASLEKDKDA